MFEAYRIGIRLSLINHVTSGLNVIAGNFNSAHKQAIGFQNTLKDIKKLAATGIAIGGAGFVGLNLFGKALKPAEEYAHQIEQMNVAGMKQFEIAKAISRAWDTTKSVPTASLNENLAVIRELRQVFKGVTHDAIEYMPTIQKLQGALQTVRHGEGGAKHEAYGIAKALEMKGANIDIGKHFIPEADMMARAIIASGGKISANDFLRTFTHGRAATQGWSNEFTYEILPTLIQELKGGSAGASSNPGTALMSAYSAVVGGTITQKGLDMWKNLGLLDPKKVVWSKDGAHVKGVKAGGIYNSDLYQSNPFMFAQYIQKKLVEHGYKTAEQQRQAYMYLFQNRTAQFAMTQFGMQGFKFTGDQQLIRGVPSAYKSYDEMLKNDPVTKRLALAKQWETLLTRIGFQVMPQWLDILDKVLIGIQGVTAWTAKHEKATKALVWGFVGLSGALAFSGTLITLTAGFKGLRLLLALFGGGSGAGILGTVRLGILAVSAAFGNGTGSGLALALTNVNAAAVAAAGGIGYLIGTLANKYLINKAVQWWTDGKEDTAGGALYDLLHGPSQETTFNRTPNFREPKTVNSVRPGSRENQGGRNGDIYLDGHKVGKVLNNITASELERASMGISTYDTSMAPAPTGYFR